MDYDPDTGHVNKQCTAQGLRDNSTWSRGQSWCIYGFTMSYRYSQLPLYLATAQRCADYWLSKTAFQGEPMDGVPLWDFAWPHSQGWTHNYRDSSAAAVAASALLELSMYGGASSSKYRAAAERLVTSLGSAYLGKFDVTEGVLVHAVGANPAWSPNNFNVSLVYGGYYAAEAAQRLSAGGSQQT